MIYVYLYLYKILAPIVRRRHYCAQVGILQNLKVETISIGRFHVFRTQKCSSYSYKHISCPCTFQESFHNPDCSGNLYPCWTTRASHKILGCSHRFCQRCTTFSLCSPSRLSIPRISSQIHRCSTHTCTCIQEPCCSSGPCNQQWCHTPTRICCFHRSSPCFCTFSKLHIRRTHCTPKHWWYKRWSDKSSSLGCSCTCNLCRWCTHYFGQRGCRRLYTFQNCRHSLHQRYFGSAEPSGNPQ